MISRTEPVGCSGFVLLCPRCSRLRQPHTILTTAALLTRLRVFPDWASQGPGLLSGHCLEDQNHQIICSNYGRMEKNFQERHNRKPLHLITDGETSLLVLLWTCSTNPTVFDAAAHRAPIFVLSLQCRLHPSLHPSSFIPSAPLTPSHSPLTFFCRQYAGRLLWPTVMDASEWSVQPAQSTVRGPMCHHV